MQKCRNLILLKTVFLKINVIALALINVYHFLDADFCQLKNQSSEIVTETLTSPIRDALQVGSGDISALERLTLNLTEYLNALSSAELILPDEEMVFCRSVQRATAMVFWK